MTQFTELLSIPVTSTPGAHAKSSSARLAEALSKSRLHSWKLGDNISSTNRRVLAGVAPYSGYDLRLLEALNELSVDPISDRIDIFDVLACQTQEDFEKYIPSIGKVYQTPVVGIWEQGRLVQKQSGHSARELLIRLYGIKKDRLR